MAKIKSLFSTGLVASALLVLGNQAYAATVVLENFENGANGWTNSSRTGVSAIASGGHDNGAYIRTVNDLATNSSAFGSALIQFRCADGCSDNDFQGDWLGQGVVALNFWFRHDAAVTLQPYIRTPRLPGNSPAASAIIDTAVAPNEWTRLVLEIDPNNPEFSSFGGGNYEDIFSAVSRLQPGVIFGVGESYSEANVTFDIDDVSLTTVPIPAAVWLFGSGLGLLGWMRRKA